MDAKKIEAIYPVSPFQQMLLAQVVETQKINQARGLLSCTVEGHIDTAAFERAWNQVVSRQPILRTSFVWKLIERPVQIVHKELKLSLKHQDWRQIPFAQQEKLLKDHLDSELRWRIDPLEPEAVRLTLSQTASDRYIFVCSYSRLLLDERSASLLLREVFVLYDGLCEGPCAPPEQALPYRDYIAWLERQDPSKAEIFWKTMLEGFSSATALVGTLAHDTYTGAEEEYGKRQHRLSSSMVPGLRQIMARHELTLTTLLEGAWAVLLSRYSGEQEVVFGVNISARSPDLGAAEMMLGPLTNTLPVLVNVCNERSARAWLRELQMQRSSLRQYAYSSLVLIREWIGQPKDLPLFESRLILDSDSVDAFSQHTFKALGISGMRNLAEAGLPLSIKALPVSDLTVEITYQHNSFDEATIERMLQHLATILEAISLNPEGKVGELSLLSQAEQQEILVEWNKTESEYGIRRCIHELFENRVEEMPEAIAVSYEQQEISYRELNNRANQLAHYLKELGVGPEVRVGICLNRSIGMIEAMLGVLKAGAAYVPLDPAYPLQRLTYVLEDAQVVSLISERELIEKLGAYRGRIISIDTDREALSRYSTENPISGVRAENLAYVIFTSGSTGRPKGVAIEHASVFVLICWAGEWVSPADMTGVLASTSICFDLSVFELFVPLSWGGRVILAENALQLLSLNTTREVTLINTVPSAMTELVRAKAIPDSVRVVNLAGEPLQNPLVQQIYRRESIHRVFNLYGPSEDTTYSTYALLERGSNRTPSIGRPIASSQVYILDQYLKPVPVEIAGELYLGGAGLARGYLNRPELTAERFIPNPYAEERGGRLYKTGDLGRYSEDGNIDFLGRLDEQVKVRGFRIELGEIEAVLRQHEGVREAVVIARAEGEEEKRLVAYVVKADDAAVSSRQLRSYLRERLPDYMTPSVYVELAALPLTPNGKVDRRALPAPKQSELSVSEEYVAPKTMAEETLAGIFKEVLKLDRVGIHDNFFELGGDSILSIQIISRANEAGLGLTPKQLYQHQSIAELAAVAGAGQPIESEQGNIAGEVPLTPIQEWFFEGHDEEPEHFNQAVMLEAREELDLEALSEVIRQLVKQHDVLRHRFLRTESGWKQICEELDGTVALEVMDLSGIEKNLESRTIEEAAGEYQKRMNLGEGPLMKVVVFGGKGRRQRVLIIAHHLVIDGVSWRILLGDIERGYEQARRGEEVNLGAKTTSYKRWAERLKEEAQSEKSREEAKYWLAEEGRSVRRLPVDRAGANTIASSRSVVASLNEEETARLLQEVPKAYKAQINEVLLGAVARSLSEWSEEQTVLVEMEGHGREEVVKDVDLTRTVGWFTTIYPVRVEVRDGDSVELLRDVKEQIREAGRRGIYYGMLMYLSEDINLRVKLRTLSQAEIIFNYLGQLDLVLREGSLFQEAKESAGETRSRKEKRRYLIEINGSITGGRLHLVWTYSENVHRRETIEAVAGRAMDVLREVVAASRSTNERPYTPSDFPLATLDQPRLDRLMRGSKDIEDIYMLSPLQKAMLFHTLSGSNPLALFLQSTCTLHGKVDVSAFKKAWQRLVDRHTILRTAFEWDDLDDPVQVVHRQVEMAIDYLDWGTIRREEQERRLEVLLEADRWRGFDLSNPPLMRLSLIRLREDQYRLIWSHHHLLLDGWSLPLILQEVFAFYGAYQQGEKLAVEKSSPYREYIGWLKRQDLQKAEAYWRGRLKGFNQPTKLWIDRGIRGTTNQEEEYEDQQVKLSGEVTAKLQAFARQHHITINTILQGAWGLLLGKYSGKEDVVFGTTVSGRPVDLPGSESIIGPFINTLPIRMRIHFQSSLLSWLSEIQSEQAEYGQYAYSSLVERYGEIPLGMPLYESILIFENYPVERMSGSGEQQTAISDFRSPVRTKYPLTIVSAPSSELLLSLAYDRRRFDGPDINRLLTHFQNLIEAMANNPEQPIWSLSPLSKTEQEQLLTGWKGSERIDLDDSYIHHRFGVRADKTPDAIALGYGEEHVTYRELNRRANQLATYLQSRRIGPEVHVGIHLEPSPALLVGVLGVIKAGGACVTLESAGNADRLALILFLQNFGVSVLLTQHSLVGDDLDVKTEILRMDSDWEMISSLGETYSNNPVNGENLAFMVYTSGSTGEPKPVMITHRGWRNHLLGIEEVVGLSQEDRVLHKSRLSIDILTLELIGPLLAGACLVLTKLEADQNHASLLDLIARQKITTVSFTPSIFSLLLREEGLGKCSSLRRVILSGEILCRPVQERSFTRLDVDLYNIYSVAEASGSIATHICRPKFDGEIVPVGHIIPNTRVYILDSHLQPVPAGVAGEVWIGGKGLARGYSDQPDLTSESFIPNPFSSDPGERIFRTKDLARSLPDGKIEILTSGENQINFKFDHIEPAIIEGALMEHPGIYQATLLLVGDAVGDSRLIAYLGCNPGSAPSVEALRRFLRERFPAQMIPSSFLTLDALPLTIDGRIDRGALAAMKSDATDSGMAWASKGTPYEELLGAIWAGLFGVDKVDRDENFFEMGGHSLLATQLMSRVRNVFKVEIPLRSIFEEPTIGGLAGRIEEAIRAGKKEEVPPLVKASREGRLPLSFAQQRLWFLDQLVPNNPFYNCPAVVKLEGRLNLEVLDSVINEIVRRHEILRTRIEVEEGEPVQVINEWKHQKLEVEDLTRLTAEERGNVVSSMTREEAVTGFDLKSGPLIRVKLLKLEEDEHVVLFTMHHIVSDGWSMGILIREVGALYQAYSAGEPSPLEELEIQYADFAVWQRQWFKGKVLEEKLEYWRKQLAGMEELELPTDHPRPAVRSYQGAKHHFVMDRNVAEKLRELGQQEGVTLFMLLLAGFGVSMSRYSGQEDVVIGTDIANRNRAEIEGLIGFFVNQLVMRVEIRAAEVARELLHRVREACLGAYAHQDVPFEKLVEELQPERDLSRSPLFQAKLILQNTPREGLELEGMKLSTVGVEVYSARVDLMVAISDVGPDLVGVVTYSRELFEGETIERLVRHYLDLLKGMVEESERPICELSLLSDQEREQIVVEWNKTRGPYPEDRCLHELFAEQAERTPDRIALVCEEQWMSYGGLNRRVNQLAHYLQGLGVGPEALVGVCLERSVEMMVALTGVLKAGGAYLPLDPESPLERLGYLLEDTGVGVVLTEQKLEKRLPAFWGQTVLMDVEWESISRESESEPEWGGVAGNPAYVIYTSGSTGKPKGVMVQHRNLVNYTHHMCQRLGVAEGDGESGLQFATVSTITADLGNTCIYPSLVSGGCLHILSYEVVTDGARFGEYLRRNPIDVLKIVPSHLGALLGTQLNGARMLPRKYLILGGEALSYELVERIRNRGEGCQVINHYGPTETTIGSLTASLSEEEESRRKAATVPIGRPIANTEVYILDRELKPVPVGMRGELYIAGGGVARGYWGRPELTAERFTPNLLGPRSGERLYRTGDVCRYLPDGSIEFLGRVDDQVKVRGYRIELREIQSVLNEHRSVKQSVVVARENERGEKRLLAYVVGEEATAVELKKYVRERLPEYMIPEAILVLEEMPVTANGKIDRKRLPIVESVGRKSIEEYTGARTPVEEIVVGIFEEVLKLDRVGISDNFFELGGHSLLATQVVSRVRNAFGVEIGVGSIFEDATVKGLAQGIEEAMRAGERVVAPPLVRISREGRLPLSFAQQRLWFIDQLEPGSAVYNIPDAVRMEGKLDLEALERVINEIVRRHEVLRTRIEVIENEPVQVIDLWEERKLEMEDLTGLTHQAREEEVEKVRREEAGTGFDLSKGPLLRVKVLRLGGEEHVVFFTMHHIVSDAWSMGILIREVGALYQAYSAGEPSPLEELEVQYADFAIWQREWLQGEALENQLAYWTQQLGGEIPILELPTDKPRPARQSHRGAHHSHLLPAALVDSLKALSLAHNCTLFMTLVAAFKTLLYYLTGQADISVGTDIANRNRAETERLIGFFINQLVLRVKLSGNSTFEELLREVRVIILGAYAHQDLPFEKLVERLKPDRDESRTPLFQVKIVLQNAPIGELKLSGLTLSPITAIAKTAKFDLLLFLVDTGRGLTTTLQYNTDLFEERTATRILNRFHILLERIAERPDAKIQELIELLIEEDKCEELEEDRKLESVRLRKLKNIRRRAIGERYVEEKQ